MDGHSDDKSEAGVLWDHEYTSYTAEECRDTFINCNEASPPSEHSDAKPVPEYAKKEDEQSQAMGSVHEPRTLESNLNDDSKSGEKRKRGRPKQCSINTDVEVSEDLVIDLQINGSRRRSRRLAKSSDRQEKTKNVDKSDKNRNGRKRAKTKATREDSSCVDPNKTKSREPNKDSSKAVAGSKKAKNKKQGVECQVCKKMLSHTGSLNVHMRTHTGVKPYKCAHCDETFSVRVNCTRHELQHSGVKDFKCSKCGASFLLARQLKDHMRRHNNPIKPVHMCDICGKRVRSHSKLQIHIRAHTGEKAFRCEICDRGFNVACNYRRHLLRHKDTREFQCDKCDRAYCEKRHLVDHQRRSHAEPTFAWLSEDPDDVSSDVAKTPFPCGQCPKLFPTASLRRDHEASHLHKCPTCAMEFITWTRLKCHMLTHAPDRSFTCDVCQKSFKTRKVLTQHQRCHAVEKKYVCQLCDASFRQHQSLWRHVQYHSEDKPHVCETCGARFNLKGDLTRHKKIHLSKKFQCQYCSRTFADRDSAVTHVAECSSHYKMEIIEQQAPAEPAETVTWICVDCNQPFQDKYKLLEHKCQNPNWTQMTATGGEQQDAWPKVLVYEKPPPDAATNIVDVQEIVKSDESATLQPASDQLSLSFTTVDSTDPKQLDLQVMQLVTNDDGETILIPQVVVNPHVDVILPESISQESMKSEMLCLLPDSEPIV